jgi:hypothetical protein
MTDYVLATKYVLGDKESVNLPVAGLDVTLAWNAPVDLDLMFFYKKTDGTEGGVFSNFFEKGSLGSTTVFPFISLSGDEGVDEGVGLKTEEGRIERIDPNMAEIHIFAVNWTDAKAGTPGASFANYDGMVQIKDASGNHDYGIPLASTEPGYFAHLATIDASGRMTRVDKVMGIGPDFFEAIPAAKFLLGPKQ